MRLRDRLAFHFLGWLPDDDARHGLGFRSFAKAVLVEEIVERRAPVRIFFRVMSSCPVCAVSIPNGAT